MLKTWWFRCCAMIVGAGILLSHSSGQISADDADSAETESVTEDASESSGNEAQDDSESGESADDPATEPTELSEEWQTLVARKQEISETLQKLQREFGLAEGDEKRRIRGEFQELVDEFQGTVYPRLVELAPAVHEQNPDDIHACELLMEQAYQQNRYEQAAELADKLIEQGRTTKFVLNTAGAAHFAIHNFEKAHQLLLDAAAKGQLDPRLGARFLEPAQEYVEHWEREQEIREREAAAEGDDALPRVEFKTSRGDIVLELFENEAPNTVANFISLVEAEEYDGTKFHRVIPNFMAQGGDPNSKDDDPTNDGLGGPGYSIKCEWDREDARMHFRGSLSMAHAGRDTGGSQFFLTHLPTYWLNGDPERGTGHTVFGRVISGLDVVSGLQRDDEIISATVIRKRDHDYQPEVIKSETDDEDDSDSENDQADGEDE